MTTWELPSATPQRDQEVEATRVNTVSTCWEASMATAGCLTKGKP